MGKTSRWFRGLLGLKKSPAPPASAEAKPPSKEKKRWGFVRSSRERDRNDRPFVAGDSIGAGLEEPVVSDPSKHAIAVAAATAAVAEAAVAAAQAAAVVVELTSSSGRCPGAQVSAEREECAAVKIQATFRGYLARRALRALKGLVRLQALVRGYIVRKQTVEALRCMQALLRVQSLVRAQSTGRSERQTFINSCTQSHAGPATPEKYERAIRSSSVKNPKSVSLKRSTSKSNKMDFVDPDRTHMGRNFSNHWLDEQHWDLRETSKKVPPTVDKILEVDLGKPNCSSIRGNTNLPFSHSNGHNLSMLLESPSKDSMTAQLSIPSPSSLPLQSPSPLRIPIEADDSVFDTAENSPQFYSASSKAASTRRGPFTPSKSECSQSFFSVYSDYPNYMADTESSRAKFRSHSAPKQRPKLEKSGSTKRLSADNKVGDGCRSSSQKSSSLHAKFSSKAYPGSGRLDRLGMPTQEMAAYNSSSRSRW